jgi:hypothetical protein
MQTNNKYYYYFNPHYQYCGVLAAHFAARVGHAAVQYRQAACAGVTPNLFY